jgi:hypothetical protein
MTDRLDQRQRDDGRTHRHHQESFMTVLRARTAAQLALFITAAAVLYAAAAALTGWEPSLGWLIQAVIHVGELSAVAALALSGAAGSGRAARVGIGMAILGQATLAGAEVIWTRAPDLGDVLFGVGPTLTGAGLVVAGIAVLRARRWTGWQRFMPLTLGIYVFAIMTPVMVGSGGPPAVAALVTIAGWDVLWALIAISTLTTQTTSDASGHPAEANAI